jgi:hypothetical protein
MSISRRDCCSAEKGLVFFYLRGEQNAIYATRNPELLQSSWLSDMYLETLVTHDSNEHGVNNEDGFTAK